MKRFLFTLALAGVVFSAHYRLNDGIELLKEAGIKVDFIDIK